MDKDDKTKNIKLCPILIAVNNPDCECKKKQCAWFRGKECVLSFIASDISVLAENSSIQNY